MHNEEYLGPSIHKLNKHKLGNTFILIYLNIIYGNKFIILGFGQ